MFALSSSAALRPFLPPSAGALPTYIAPLRSNFSGRPAAAAKRARWPLPLYAPCRRQAPIMRPLSAPCRRQAPSAAACALPPPSAKNAPSLKPMLLCPLSMRPAPLLRLLLHLHFYTWPWPLFDCFGPGQCPVFIQAVRHFCIEHGSPFRPVPPEFDI